MMYLPLSVLNPENDTIYFRIKGKKYRIFNIVLVEGDNLLDIQTLPSEIGSGHSRFLLFSRKAAECVGKNPAELCAGWQVEILSGRR